TDSEKPSPSGAALWVRPDGRFFSRSDSMSLIPILSDEAASPEARVMFRHSERMFGRVANAMRVASHSPKLAQSIFGFIVASLREVITGVLDVRTKTLVILKTSTLNGCRY
ncbi:MAG: hypothetical protein QGI11_08720, partial [Nitrospinota bacterium]|nr:hypothetical protein [Nitrospinota bacterium]